MEQSDRKSDKVLNGNLIEEGKKTLKMVVSDFCKVKLLLASWFSSFPCRFPVAWGSGLDGKPSGSSYWERLRVCLWSTRTTTTRARSSSLRPQTSKQRPITFTQFPVNLCSTVYLILVKYHNKTVCYYSVSCDSFLIFKFEPCVLTSLQMFVTISITECIKLSA